jgi:SAM-dependent methyltransferase
MSEVIWHDLECGGYVEDLTLWHSLADEQGDPVLDVGAGTGRVALALARRGHRVTALDSAQGLLDELRRRADGLDVDAVCADAREFELGQRFALCLVPMQTIQLMDGRNGRIAFLRCARAHLDRGGLIAIAIAEMLELYEVFDEIHAPLPDICELDGVVYSSQPTAVRVDSGRFVLERRRETVSAAGERSVSDDVVSLDRVTCAQLEREAAEVGLRPAGRTGIPPTRDYVGSEVVMLRA